MREASESRLPRAKEAKQLRLGEPERWPIAAVIHLCATSHTSPSPPLPLFLKSACMYDGIIGVRTSYFSFMKTSATKFKENKSCYCDEYLPLLGFQTVDWTKKSNFLLAGKHSQQPVSQVRSSAAQASVRRYPAFSLHDPLLSGFFFL